MYQYNQALPVNFDQWTETVLGHASALPQTLPKAIRANVTNINNNKGNDKGTSHSPGNGGDVSEATQDGPESQPTVKVNSFNNYRQAQAGTSGGTRPRASGGGPGRNSSQPNATAEQLALNPVCKICKGRHLEGPPGRCKPNEFAKDERFHGTRQCDYKTKPHDVVCRGAGHERKHHIRFMQELQARRGS